MRDGGDLGDFTVTSHSTTYTVDVGASSTDFQEKGVTTPSFAIVCPGSRVKVTGAISTDNIVRATAVTVIPPRPQHVWGRGLVERLERDQYVWDGGDSVTSP